MNPLNANSNGPTRIRRALHLASVLPSVLASLLAFQLPFVAPASAAPSVTPGKVLFDATKAEMAANADWILDTDVNNIGTGTNGAMVVGAGSEANPQRFPTPAASGITSTTAETYWKGALSSWGVALVKRGFSVETLPIGGRITYGDATNTQDLSYYGIYVLCEPNILLTAAEKNAMVRFVADGGGLFVVGDHNASDRNSDGFDSVDVINDLAASNGVVANPFGIVSNLNSYSLISSFVATSATDPLINGAAGAVAQMQYSAGATLSISGRNAKGAIWRTAAHASNDVMVAYSTYGLGKIVMCGDSSPFDDGTGDTNDTLFAGWAGEVNGDHAQLAINACLWLNPVVVTPCPADVDANHTVNGGDLAMVLQAWGPCSNCAADLDNDNIVSASDLAMLLQSWGACP